MMTKWEFWCRLRKLERKYDKKTRSPVHFRLRRIDEWASSIMEGWSPTTGVPRWLCNELIHVEEGRGIGPGGLLHGAPPACADLMLHGVLTERPIGNTVLPSDFVLDKALSGDGRDGE